MSDDLMKSAFFKLPGFPGEVFDQGSRNTCVASALAAMLEYYLQFSEKLSVQFIYAAGVQDSSTGGISFEAAFDAVKKYDTTFFPAGHRNRMLIAPIVYGVPLSSKERINTILNGILCHLTSYDSQTFLAKEAGLAPVHANAPTPDIQGNDVRYWVAATNRPLAALADAAFETDAELNKAAETFRTMILEYVYTNTR